MKSEMKTNEGDKIFSLKCNEPIEQDEEASFGFVLGYN
jgi:hypothetical protein